MESVPSPVYVRSPNDWTTREFASKITLLKEYIYFLSCLLWHLFVYFTSCMFLFYFSFLWVLSLTLVNKFSTNIGFSSYEYITFLKFFLLLFVCTESLLFQWLFTTCGKQGWLSTCSGQTSHFNAFSCYSVWALSLCSVVVTPELWNTKLWPTGLVAPRYARRGMEPLCPALITRWILYLWARREAPKLVPWHVSWNQWTE